jgi:hypothetical protein
MLKFIKGLFVGGLSVIEALFTSDKSLIKNTASALKQLAITAIRQGLTPQEFAEKLDKTIKTKKREALSTLKDVMSATQHEIRAKTSKNVIKWVNYGIMDDRQSLICARYMGMEWKKWSDLKPRDKPPRHKNCRSKVLPMKKGDKQLKQDPLIIQFLNSGKAKQKKYLGVRRYEAWQRGDIEIKTNKQLLRVKTFKIKDLLKP